jgi:hypothetical protein
VALEDSLRSVRDRRGLRVNEDLIVWAARLESGRRSSGRAGVTAEILQDTWRRMHITVSAQENADLMTIIEEARQQDAAPAAAPAAAPQQQAPVNGSAEHAQPGPPSWYSAPPVVPAAPATPADNAADATQLVGSGTVAAADPRVEEPAAEQVSPNGGPSWYSSPPQTAAPHTPATPQPPQPPQPPAAPRVEHAAPRVEHTAPRVEHTAPRVEHTAPRVEHTAPRVEHPAPRVEQTGPPLSALHKPGPVTPAPVPSGPLPDAAMFSGEADVFAPVDGYIGLAAQVDRVNLMWEPADPAGAGVVLYLVVGTHSAVPNTAAEGERLAVTAECLLAAPPGYRYYAVFAYRGSSPLAAAQDRAATRLAVGQVVPPPINVQYLVNPDSVVLEWRQPPDVTGVQLRRSRPDEPLPPFEDSTLVKPVQPGQTTFLDQDVEPGASYVYELVCLANAPRVDGGVDRSPAWSSGPLVVPAVPQRVLDLTGTIADVDDKVRCTVSWTTVRRGKVDIYAKPGSPGRLGELSPDEVLDAAGLSRLPLGNRVVWSPRSEGGRDLLEGFAVDTSASSEWCYTPVTETAGRFAVGPSLVLTHVGTIPAVDLTDRIAWQFLRFEWPAGATEVMAEVGGQLLERISRERWQLYGGLRLNLPPHRCTVRLWGSRTYRGVALHGRPIDVPYTGRQLLYYMFEWDQTGRATGVRVRSETPLTGLTVSVVGGTELAPLSQSQLGRPGFGPVATFQIPAGGLPPEGTRYPLETPPQARFLKLVARADNGLPVATWEWSEQPPAAPRVSRRCPNCLAPPDPKAQYFRCSRQGNCLEAEDTLLTKVRGTRTLAKPWTSVDLRPSGPVGQVECEHCGVTTRDEFCKQCGETFPMPDWWQYTSAAATLLGPPHSGKTSMLQAISYSLLEGLAESWGGHADALDPVSRATMRRYHDDWIGGALQAGTISAAQNRNLLRPIEFSVKFAGSQRPVAFSLFDVAGEDTGEAERLEVYESSMLNGDALIYLVDPLEIEEIRRALDGFVNLPDPVGVSPVQALQNVITVLRRRFGSSVPLPTRLAVVFSKFDAIQQATSVPGSPVVGALPPGCALLRDPYANPSGPLAGAEVFDAVDGLSVHHEARTLLSLLGGQTLLNLVESNFPMHHYFVSSSTGHTPANNKMHSTARAPHRLLDPLRWVIQG